MLTWSTHRILQIDELQQVTQDKAKLNRRCAGKAADIGNRAACAHFIRQAQKCDSIAIRCSEILGQDRLARQRRTA